MNRFIMDMRPQAEPLKLTRRGALGIGATLVGGALLVGCSPSAIGKAMSIGAHTTSAPLVRSSRSPPTAR